MKELNIIEGFKNESFIKESGLYIPKSNPLTKLLPIIYHVDTYKQKDSLYRVQGYFYISEFLALDMNKVPSELKLENCETGLKKGRPIVFIQIMGVTDDYPF
jgi:hypothetical protein